MGMSDFIVLPQQKAFINFLLENDYIVNDNEQVSKIAYLGNSNTNETVAHYKHLFPDAQHDLYDIVLENWNIDDEWEIENYDIVVCHRTTMYVKNIDFFIKQLKECVSKNENVIFDFTLYAGLLDDYGSTRTPPSLTAKFDFRDLPNTVDFHSGIPDWQNYFNATMTNCVTEETFKTNNISTSVMINRFNNYKKDLITYAFWNKSV